MLLHHTHGRKPQKATYHHRNFFSRLLDYLIYIIAVVGPLFTLPQLYLIWRNQSADGVSLQTWLGYTAIAVIWLLYGIAHKAKPIIVSNILWSVVNGLVVVGTLLYSGQIQV